MDNRVFKEDRLGAPYDVVSRLSKLSHCGSIGYCDLLRTADAACLTNGYKSAHALFRVKGVAADGSTAMKPGFHLAASMAMLLCGPSLAQGAPDCQIDQQGYVGGYVSSHTSVVVFIHGVLSNPRDAWGTSDTSWWPCLLRKDSVFEKTNVFVASYDTAWGDSPSTDDIAPLLLGRLNSTRVTAHSHITLVAHSMGGIVASKLLMLARENQAHKALLSRIRLVQFYGTPAEGADIAKLASLFSDSRQFLEMRDASKLKPVVERWLDNAWSFHWSCFAEGSKTAAYKGPGSSLVSLFFSTEIVNEKSAASLCKGRVLRLAGKDHMDIVKPQTTSGIPYEYLQDEFNRCVRSKMSTRASSTTKPQGRAIVGWFDNFRNAVTPDDRVQSESKVRDALLKRADLDIGANAYLIPRAGITPDLSLDANVRGYYTDTLQAFLDQVIPLIKSFAPENVYSLSELVEKVPAARELIDSHVGTALLEPADHVLVLTRGDDAYKLLIFARSPSTAPGPTSVRLTGFAWMTEPSQCPVSSGRSVAAVSE